MSNIKKKTPKESSKHELKEHEIEILKKDDQKNITERMRDLVEQSAVGDLPELNELLRLQQENQLPTLGGYLNRLMGLHTINGQEITTDRLSDWTGINRSTLYRILKGEVRPSRNSLLRIALAVGATFEETQFLLKCGNTAELSGRRPRDVIIMTALLKNWDEEKTNQALLQYEMEPLNHPRKTK